jgi:ribose/xylose/arabinose/galactoside ABC-type transport system permease subunit
MAIGMTFVLLIAGVDLSIGAAMYVSAAILILYFPWLPGLASILLMAFLGAVFGAINATFIVKLKVIPFVVTIATLYVGRGFALYLSSTRTILAPETVLSFGEGSWLGVSYAILTLAILFVIALWVERWTPFGRYLYAMGADFDGARKAGIPVWGMSFAVYVLCGTFAGVGGFISLSQTAAASTFFGYGVEFPVIAAAVLGGTSLFGGRGSVIGSVFGAVLIQTVQNGLVLLNINPYVYPLVISGIIFVAVLLDSQRTQLLTRLTRRLIRTETT